MRVTARVEAADVASSLTPLMLKAPLPKVLALNAVAVPALLAPSVANADRKTALDLDELAPIIDFSTQGQHTSTGSAVLQLRLKRGCVAKTEKDHPENSRLYLGQ